MPEPTAYLLAVRASTADLLLGLDAAAWSDADLRVPSLCPGWSRAHVLAHLLGNADGIAAMLSGALRGEVVPRYPDGRDVRDAAVAAGAARPAAQLLAALRESTERLDRVLGAVADADAWARPAEDARPAGHWVYRRLREVEIHRVDLHGDYGPERWPSLLLSTLLPEAAATLAERATEAVHVRIGDDGSVVPELVGRDWTVGTGRPVEVTGPDWAVLAWLLGRGSVAADALSATPDLAPWR